MSYTQRCTIIEQKLDLYQQSDNHDYIPYESDTKWILEMYKWSNLKCLRLINLLVSSSH